MGGPATLRAVIFDLDDTLIDQASAASAAVVDWALAHDVSGPGVVQRWTELIGLHHGRYQRREVTFQGQRRDRVRDFLAVDLSDEAADRLFADYLWRYEAGWRLFDDAVPALRRARARGLLAVILTNGERAQQAQKLDALGLADEIDLLVCSSDLPAGKPDPAAFHAALQLAGVGPDEALMVGDSLDNDVHGALGAGVAAVLLDRTGRHTCTEVSRVSTLADLVLPDPPAPRQS